MLTQGKHLTKEEELSVGNLIQKGMRTQELIDNGTIPSDDQHAHMIVKQGEEAAKRLVEANLGLVYNEAYRYKKKFPSSPELDDLFGEGLLGLWTAVKKYDPSFGNKFSTLAVWWIRQSITRGVNNTSRLVRLPENRVANFSQIIDIQKQGEEDGLSTAEIAEKIKEEIGLTDQQAWDILSAGATHTSLNMHVGMHSSSSDDGKEMMDYNRHINNERSAESSMMKNETIRKLNSILESFSEVEYAVISAAHKMGMTDLKTQKAVRDKYGLTPSRFRTIASGCMQKIRNEMTEEDLRAVQSTM